MTEYETKIREIANKIAMVDQLAKDNWWTQGPEENQPIWYVRKYRDYLLKQLGEVLWTELTAKKEQKENENEED